MPSGYLVTNKKTLLGLAFVGSVPNVGYCEMCQEGLPSHGHMPLFELAFIVDNGLNGLQEIIKNKVVLDRLSMYFGASKAGKAMQDEIVKACYENPGEVVWVPTSREKQVEENK